MPMDKTRYPDSWDHIARCIKDRDGWTCQACGVQHNTYIVRLRTNPKVYRYITKQQAEDEYAIYATRIVMTVHHIGIDYPDGTPGDPDDKMDCRPENLITLCPRCHLLADQDGHLKHAAETRARKRREGQLAGGQGELF